MIYLLLTILLNTVLSVILKLFPKYGIDTFQAIVVNYCVCVITGSMFIGHFPITQESPGQPWFVGALALGAGFITVFNLLGYCTRTDGITAATVANKLSLAIPVVLSIYLYDEHLSFLKIAGLVLSFPAVLLATRSEGGGQHKSHHLIWLALLFAGSGLLDAGMKYMQHHFLPTENVQASFTIHLFAVAGVIGAVSLSVLLVTGRKTFSWRNVAGGIVLGIPNYFSIYTFVCMLDSTFLPSAASIPLNNIGILISSSVVAMMFFREKASPRRLWGILMSVVVIFLLAAG